MSGHRAVSSLLWALAGSVALLAFSLGGCAGYELGDAGKLPFASVHVAPPVNASLAPQAAPLLGNAVVRELDRSGRVTVTTESSADAVLTVTLTDFRRELAATREDDTGFGRKWRVILTAECTLTDRRAGEVVFEKRPVSAFDEVYGDDGLVPAEYQNMPVLTELLGRAIAREVLGVW